MWSICCGTAKSVHRKIRSRTLAKSQSLQCSFVPQGVLARLHYQGESGVDTLLGALLQTQRSVCTITTTGTSTLTHMRLDLTVFLPAIVTFDLLLSLHSRLHQCNMRLADGPAVKSLRKHTSSSRDHKVGRGCVMSRLPLYTSLACWAWDCCGRSAQVGGTRAPPQAARARDRPPCFTIPLRCKCSQTGNHSLAKITCHWKQTNFLFFLPIIMVSIHAMLPGVVCIDRLAPV